jgi:hypothetical protein
MPITAKLDELGKPAWIALMVLGFVVWWPVGLATLAFIIWSGRMGWCGHRGYDRWQRKMERMQERMDRFRAKMGPGDSAVGSAGAWAHSWGHSSSGNRAFDDYRSETLRRLEDEQREFREFLDRLRLAKDKVEFDQFMAERRNPRPSPPSEPQPQA